MKYKELSTFLSKFQNFFWKEGAGHASKSRDVLPGKVAFPLPSRHDLRLHAWSRHTMAGIRCLA